MYVTKLMSSILITLCYIWIELILPSLGNWKIKVNYKSFQSGYLIWTVNSGIFHQCSLVQIQFFACHFFIDTFCSGASFKLLLSTDHSLWKWRKQRSANIPQSYKYQHKLAHSQTHTHKKNTHTHNFSLYAEHSVLFLQENSYYSSVARALFWSLTNHIPHKDKSQLVPFKF